MSLGFNKSVVDPNLYYNVGERESDFDDLFRKPCWIQVRFDF
jgi:hypothetical protein